MSADTEERRAREDWPQIITTTLVGFLSVLAIVLGVVTTNAANRAQQRLTEQGQVTERFGSDINLLGSHELDVRVGGVYALERLMQDSSADETKIVEVLSAFIRDHSPESVPASSHTTTSPCRSGGTTSNGRPSHPSDDAQAALEVLGRRPVPVNHPDDAEVALEVLGRRSVPGNHPDIHIDLTWADVTGASLPRANLNGADLRCAGLTRTYLAGASLRGAFLRWAYLIRADLTGADLTDAHLLYTDLTRAKFIGADLTGADLTGANLTGADLTGANLTGALWPTGVAVPKGWERDTTSDRLKRRHEL